MLKFVVDKAKKDLDVLSVILFGSRARRDHRGRSDFELAFNLPEEKIRLWSKFATELDDEIPTLCDLDLLCLNCGLDQRFRGTIDFEGITIYEQSKA